MAGFIFENDSKEWKCIEVIKCPNQNDCNSEMGDGRYDTFNIPPGASHTVESKCNEICWRYSGETYQRESNRTIPV